MHYSGKRLKNAGFSKLAKPIARNDKR